MHKPVRTLLVGAALAAALLTAAPVTLPASAQELNLGPIIDPSVAGNNAAIDAAARAVYERKMGKEKGRAAYEEEMRRLRSRGGASSATSAASGSTRFSPNSATRQRTVAAWMAKMRTSSPQGAATVQRMLAGRDPIATLAAGYARYGLRTDDLADVMTAYLVTAWYGVRGSNEDPSPASVRATRAQIRQVLLANPKFSSSSNAVKQQLADTLLLQGITIEQRIGAAKGNPAQMQRAKSSIRQDALSLVKIDMTKLKLTDQGLRL